jgi:hypothetical protein
MPYTLKLDPILAMLLIDRAEPIETRSKAEKQLAMLVTPYIDNEDPSRENVLIDIQLPICVLSKTDMKLPK